MSKVDVWRFSESTFEKIHPNEESQASINSIAEELPSGVYTTFRTYQGDHTLSLDHHFDRLEESVRLLGGNLTIDRNDLRCKLRIAISEQLFPDYRIRIHIPLNPQKRNEGFLLAETLTQPTSYELSHGASIITRHAHRDNPLAKATTFLKVADEIRKECPENVNEILMIGEDERCLEGLSSNFYAIVRGEIWTAEKNVLHGITREIVLEVAKTNRIPLNFEGISVRDLFQVDEAFITSTSRGVLPVTNIDGQKVGQGMPGPITQMIRKAFNNRIAELIQPI